MAQDEKRFFTTLPVAMIADRNLTALDIRCAMVIAMHDGMSAVSGKGGGCFAKSQTLAALARTDATNFSKSLTRLIRLDYVRREPQVMDKRRFTLRIQYPRDNSWRTDQAMPPQIDAETGEIVGESANPESEIVGDGENENPSFSKENGRDYISLNEELHFDESKKLNSTKWRDFGHSCQPTQKRNRKAAAIGELVGGSIELDSAQSELGSVSLRANLPAKFDALDSEAQVACVERAFKPFVGNADLIDDKERGEIASLLWTIADAFHDEPTGRQAARLHEELGVF